jgi:hypothetical protein
MASTTTHPNFGTPKSSRHTLGTPKKINSRLYSCQNVHFFRKVIFTLQLHLCFLVSRGVVGGLPFVEEGQDIFGSHGTGSFELTAFLAEEEFAIGIKNSDGGDAAIERNIVFFGDVEILIHLADVDVGDDKGSVERGGNFGRVKGFVEDMAIKAPVAAEDQEDPFVGSRGGVQSFRNFLVGVNVLVDFLVFEGLAKARGCRMSDDAEVPLAALAEPVLLHGDELFSGGDARLHAEGELDDEGVDVGRGLLLLNDLSREIGEAPGFEGGPEGDFVRKGDRLFARTGNLWDGGTGV